LVVTVVGFAVVRGWLVGLRSRGCCCVDLRCSGFGCLLRWFTVVTVLVSLLLVHTHALVVRVYIAFTLRCGYVGCTAFVCTLRCWISHSVVVGWIYVVDGCGVCFTYVAVGVCYVVVV